MIRIYTYLSKANFAQFKVEKFENSKYKTICSILKEKYYPINEEVQSAGKSVKLLDEKGKLIGMYSLLEARKKCSNNGNDLVLVNGEGAHIICKTIPLRKTLLNKFYTEVVLKGNE